MNNKTVSETSIITSYVVLPQDANASGNAHGGVIMKLIDNTAGVVASRHARCSVVTASIDRLDFHNPAFVGNLLILSAGLNLVGRSSMEVGVRVEAEDLLTGDRRHIASAYLTFVAMDEHRQPQKVTPLTIESDEENRRNAQAQNRRLMRLAERTREKSESS